MPYSSVTARSQSAGGSALDGLALIFRDSNQLPTLGMADRTIPSPGLHLDDAGPAARASKPMGDSLELILKRKAQSTPALLQLAM
jgi:hypothetical protein